jgi:predicted O-methyltransferase YrrM
MKVNPEVFKSLEALDGQDELAVSADEGRILYNLVLAEKPAVILEVGTGHGYSTAWMSLALGLKANLYTLDCEMRNRVADQVGIESKKVHYLVGTLEALLPELPSEINFAFLDSSHRMELVAKDIELLEPRISKGGLIVVHDTVYQREMGLCLRDYFQGLASERLATVEVKPSLSRWAYEEMQTKYGFGIATKTGKGIPA